MSSLNRIPAEAHRTGVRIGDPTLADTLEALYLRPALDELPPEWRTAVDLASGAGHVSAELMARGFRVLGFEQDAPVASSLRLRFEAELRTHQFQLEQRSPIARDGALAEMLDAHGFREIGLARVAGDAGQWSALNALALRRRDLPAIVMFHIGSESSDVALGCLGFLWAHGYRNFDLFMKRGSDPVAAERFTAPELPPAWHSCAGRDMSAAFIAYHASPSTDVRRLNPVRFLSDFQVLKSQHLLRCALKQEAVMTFQEGAVGLGMDGLIASRIRSEMRADILAGGWAGFLVGRIGRHMGARATWGLQHERQRSDLGASRFGRLLVERLREPRVGAGTTLPSRVAAGLSVPMTGALYDAMRIHEHSDGRLPRRVVEVSAGWGLAAYVYCSVVHDAAYAIVDHPEALAIQHYFLTLALPGTEVEFAQSPATGPKPGAILLVPTSWLRQQPATLNCELLHSAKSLDQLFPSIRRSVSRFRGFHARNSYFSGEWMFEGEAVTGRPQSLAA